jgi:hypothetical protein
MNWSPRARGGSRGFFGWLETEMVGCLFCKETNQPQQHKMMEPQTSSRTEESNQ